MSHDIRTPINTILGFSEMLKENIPDDPILNEYIGNICSSGNLLLSIINEILEFSKIESGKITLKYRPVNILSVFEEITAQFEDKIRDKGLDSKINTDLFFKDLFVNLDEVRFKQTIINIIDNAYKYTDTGHINIIVQKNSVNGRRLDMSITVEDTGPGLTDREKIFEEFEQIQPSPEKIIEGAGLGLAIVKKLVTLMNGSISVENNKPQGTIFEVRFPKIEIVNDQEKKGETDFNITSDILFHGQVVLIADDNQRNRSLLREYTKTCGLKIVEAKNGKEAVDITETQNVSLVLIDIKMPIMGGIEATRMIKQGAGAKIPIIAITADISDQTKDEAIASGVDSILLKPISRKTLVEEIMKWLPHRKIETENPNTQNKGIKVKVDIDPDRKAEILKSLETLKTNELEKISRTMIISDIKDFAGKVEKIGCDFGSCYLEEWGKLLKKNAENYRNKKTQEMVNQYPDLIEMINDGQ
jgi:CheY-like chemotaxis protein